jgi:hypothetical protein
MFPKIPMPASVWTWHDIRMEFHQQIVGFLIKNAGRAVTIKMLKLGPGNPDRFAIEGDFLAEGIGRHDHDIVAMLMQHFPQVKGRGRDAIDLGRIRVGK